MFMSQCFYLQKFGATPPPGAHRPPGFREKDESLIPLNRSSPQTVTTNGVKRATEMECFKVWDATRAKSVIFDLAAFPVLCKASEDPNLENAVQDASSMRGKWETLMRTGMVFDCCPSIKVILGDGHGSHQWLHNLLLGLEANVPPGLLSKVPFFKDLTFRPLPAVCFPLQWRVAVVEGQSVHYIPGQFQGNIQVVLCNLKIHHLLMARNSS